MRKPLDPSQPLPNQQQDFANYVAAGKEIEASYAAAGYKADTRNGYAALRKPHVAARVAWIKQQDTQPTVRSDMAAVQNPADPVRKPEVTREYVLNALLENAEICLGLKAISATVLKKTRVGEEPATVTLSVTDRDAAAANRALELLGKELGLFEGAGKDAGQANQQRRSQS